MNKLQTPILSIETSGENCSVSVYSNNNRKIEINFYEKNIHSEILFDLIEKVLSISKTKKEEIEAIAVSEGPGSFTGLRIGYAAAKGLAYGLSKPIVEVPTFDALAMEISNYVKDEQTFYLARKANNTEHYLASFRKTNSVFEKLQDVLLINKEELMKLCKNQIVFSDTSFENSLLLPDVNATIIAKWAYLFGEKLLTYNFEFSEPKYFKNFIPKVKK